MFGPRDCAGRAASAIGAGRVRAVLQPGATASVARLADPSGKGASHHWQCPIASGVERATPRLRTGSLSTAEALPPYCPHIGRLSHAGGKLGLMKSGVYVSRLGWVLRDRNLPVSELRRRLGQRGHTVSRGALDRLMSERPLRTVDLDVLMPILEELDVEFRAAFEHLPAAE